MGFSRQQYWSGFPCSPPGDLPNPGTESRSLMSSALACWFFTTSTTWETYIYEMESLCCTAEINIVYQLFDVQSLSCIRLFATLWSAAHLASLSFTIYWSLLKFMPIELVMLSNHLILCHPLFLLPSIFPSIKVFSNKLTLSITWPKY